MPFDPKAYLAKDDAPKKSGFDPKAYLAADAPAPPEPKVGTGFMDRLSGLFSSDGREELQDAIAKAEPEFKRTHQDRGMEANQAALEHFGDALTLNHLPHIEAAVEPYATALGNAITGDNVEATPYVQARDANIRRLARQSEEFPKASFGGTAAGLVTGALALPLPELNAAKTALGAARQGAVYGGAFAALQNPGDKEGVVNPLQLTERVEAMPKGMALGGTLGLGGHALLSGGRAVGEAANIQPKANAEEIKAAAARLGIEPTVGMTHDSPVLQGLESSLHQSPSLGGALMRRETMPVANGMQKTAEGLFEDASGLTPDQAGMQAKKQIGQSVDQMFEPHAKTFQDLQQYTKDINATPTSRNAVARNVMNIPEVATFEDGAPASVARSVVKALEKDPSANAIKQLKTMVGQKAAAADRGDQPALWQIYAKLSKLEENTIKRGVIQSARTADEGDTIASGMLGQLKGARQGWKAGLDKIGDFSDSAGLGRVNSPDQFGSKIEGIQNEKMQSRLFNPHDNEMSTALKETFPEAYSTLRGGALSQLEQAAADTEGKVSAGKVLSATRKNAPEANAHLFGEEGSQRLGDLRTVDQSLPDKVGPSGTPQGLGFQNMTSPWMQVKELGRYGLYKAATSENVQRVARYLSQSPQFQRLAETNPKAFQALVVNIAERRGGHAPGGFPAADFDRSSSDTAQHDPSTERMMPIDQGRERFLKGN